MQSTSNYLARRYGVRAAMPGFIAKKLCPDLVIVKLNFTKYRQVSQQMREVLKKYDPGFCPVGLDESYLDLTEFVKRRMSCKGDIITPGVSCGSDNGRVVANGKAIKIPECTVTSHGVLHNGQAERGVVSQAEGGVVTVDTPGKLGSEVSSANRARSNCESATIMTGSVHPDHSQSMSRSSETTTLNIATNLEECQTFDRATKEALALAGMSPESIEEEGDSLLHVEAGSTLGASWGLPPSHWKCAQGVVEEMRTEIFSRTGLTASAGIAPNMMLAKVASDMNKPNGQYFVVPTREGVLEFVRKLPIRKASGRIPSSLSYSLCPSLPPSLSHSLRPSLLLPPAFPISLPPSLLPYLTPSVPPSFPISLSLSLPPSFLLSHSLRPSLPPSLQISGIGRVTERLLNAFGVTTCQDLYDQRALLHLLFSQVSSQSFLRICMGISSAQVHRYSIS